MSTMPRMMRRRCPGRTIQKAEGGVFDVARADRSTRSQHDAAEHRPAEVADAAQHRRGEGLEAGMKPIA